MQWFVFNYTENEFESYNSYEEAMAEFIRLIEKERDDATDVGEWYSTDCNIQMGVITHDASLMSIEPDPSAPDCYDEYSELMIQNPDGSITYDPKGVVHVEVILKEKPDSGDE